MSDYTPDPMSAWLSGLGKKRFDDPNQYSSYPEGTKYSLPTYVGPATNAMGQVNQSYQAPQTHTTTVPGTTINTPAGLGGSEAERQLAGWGALDPIDIGPNALAGLDRSFGSSMATMPLGVRMQNAQSGNIGANMPASLGGGSGQQSTPDVTTTTTDPNRDNYLSSMAHPDAPPTFGANVPQAPLPGQGKSVLDTFLAAHQASPAPSGGGYDNSGFFDTLNKLKSGGGSGLFHGDGGG
jgi:hypothetical protein